MAANTANVEIVHAAVPGRVRIRVAGLPLAGLVRRLGTVPAIFALSAGRRTGTLLIFFDPGLPLAELLDDVGRAATHQAEATRPDPAWHALPAAETLARLASPGAEGLGRDEARRRLARHGRNRLPLPRRRSFAAIFGSQFRALPVILLAGSAVVSLVSGALFEGVAILVVVAVNGLIGASSETQAERMIARLESRRRLLAVVRRGGRQLTIDAEEVVPGDVLVLSPGLTVAADCRLIEADGFVADESVLTGESMPVAKRADSTVAATTPLAERANMVWRGTLAAAGSALAVAVATGRETEVGRIQALIGDVARPQTPLQRELDRLGRRLVVASGGAALLMVGLGLLRGQALASLLRSGVALAVAAIPEGLPTVATLTLALAVRDLERRNVLVRRLEAVEAVGAVATIFFDKTGTLTVNRMAVAEIRADGPGAESRLWRVAALCSDAAAAADGKGGWTVEGSSTEAALVGAALAHGIDVPSLRQAHPRLSERYRDDRRQSMATTHDLGGGRSLLAVKGSPAEVLAECAHRVDDGDGPPLALTEADRARIEADNQAMAARGLRVLGFAQGAGGNGESDLCWLGLVALSDPPRPGVEGFIATLHRAGIETVMLTGDQAATARAVAAQLGISSGLDAEVADSSQVETLAPADLAALAERIRVFARILPSHKLKVVQAYRRGGRVVAMVGDGVNDGPALKAADIGVTMGRHGSRAARDLSDLVLEDDDLGGLVTAIGHGRATQANIRRAVDFMLATNLSETAVMVAATALGLGQPLGAAQLLWLNLVTDVLPGLALSREPAEPGGMERPPPDAHGAFLDRAAALRLSRQGAVLAAGPLAAYAWAGGSGGGGRAAAMTCTAMVAGQMLHAAAARSHPPNGARSPWLPAAVIGTLALQAAALAVPGLRRVLGFARLSGVDLAVTAAAALAPALVNAGFPLFPSAYPRGGTANPARRPHVPKVSHPPFPPHGDSQ